MRGKKITEQEFSNIVKEKFPDIEILTPYVSPRVKITRKCNVCGDVRDVQPRLLMEGHGCQICASRERAKEKTKTHEQFVKEMKQVNPNIDFLTEYKNTGARIKCKCLVDGFEWDATPHILLEGHGCPECYRKKANRRNENEFLSELKEQFPTVKLKSKYVRIGVKVDYECAVCGYEWSAIPDTILNNPNSVGCPRCAGRAKVTEEEYKKRVAKANKFVEYIGGFNGMLGHAQFKCVKCGFIWDTTASSIENGSICPRCKMSRGESAIESYLNDNHIDYIAQYRFSDCKNERQLPFDFYIPSHNMCVEYDGEQHFMPVTFGGISKNEAKRNFEHCKANDRIKDNYCKHNGIHLVRIPYTDFNNINEILDKHIS